MADQTWFHIEWGGEADLCVEAIWPDGDAPENPTTDDVIAEFKRNLRGSHYFGRVASDWNMDIEDIEVSGPGGWKSLAREIRPPSAARNQKQG